MRQEIPLDRIRIIRQVGFLNHMILGMTKIPVYDITCNGCGKVMNTTDINTITCHKCSHGNPN